MTEPLSEVIRIRVPPSHAARLGEAAALSGLPLSNYSRRRAADDTLCLPSSLRPGECSPSLDHDSGILEDYRHGLDWDAAVAARRAFLAQCPAATGNPSTHTSPETQKRGIV